MKKSIRIPYDFILNELFELDPFVKKMFGTHSIYIGEKIYFALRESEKKPIDNGIWIATNRQHHDTLFQMFDSLRYFETIPMKKWILLPADADDFEEVGMALCEMVKENHPAVGTIPNSKKKK